MSRLATMHSVTGRRTDRLTDDIIMPYRTNNPSERSTIAENILSIPVLNNLTCTVIYKRDVLWYL